MMNFLNPRGLEIKGRGSCEYEKENVAFEEIDNGEKGNQARDF